MKNYLNFRNNFEIYIVLLYNNKYIVLRYNNKYSIYNKISMKGMMFCLTNLKRKKN
jgi:hypothetical protein